MATHKKERQEKVTQRDANSPVVSDMVSVLFEELMSHIDLHALLRVKSVGNRGRQVGLLATLLCNSVEKSSIYYKDGQGQVFNGKTYQAYRTEDLAVCVRKILESDKWCFDESMRRNGVIQDICANVKSLIRTRRLELDKNLVAFRNGIYDLQNMNFMPHSKKYAPFCYLDFDFDPSATCPKWESFLEDVLPPNKRQLLQEFVGATLIDRKKFKLECMMILYGAGSNGKSVIAHTLANLFGQDNVTHFSLDDLLYSQDQSKNTDKLNNKLLNYSEEISAVNSSRFGDRLKALISGDSVMCRPIYGESYAADNLPLLMANANRLPKMDDTSHGLLRRLIILEFEKIIPTNLQDHTLEAKLEMEKSGIFNWILAGRESLIANNGNFSSNEVIEEAAESFMIQNNSVLEFMYEKEYYPTPATPEEAVHPMLIKLKEAYSQYDQWCVTKRYRPKSNSEFRVILESRGYVKHKKNVGMCFDVYGKKVTEAVKEDMALLSAPESMLKGWKHHQPIVLNDGRVVVRGDSSAAAYAHLSVSWITSMRLSGKLTPAMIDPMEYDLPKKYSKSHSYYDINVVVEIAQKHKAYLTGARLKEFEESVEQDVNACVIFNQQMRNVGQPFRKLCVGLPKQQQFIYGGANYVFVDNDWQYTEEAAAELLLDIEKTKLAKLQ